LTDAQTWTLIGGFLAVTVAMNALILAIVRSEISGLRREMVALIDGLRNEMIARFEAVHQDLQHLYERVFPAASE
jgi:hypothetical protein